MTLHSKQVPVEYREYEYGLILCSSLFKQIVESDQHKLAGLLPASNDSERLNFRTRRMFSIPSVKTKRFKNTFIIHFATKQQL